MRLLWFGVDSHPCGLDRICIIGWVRLALCGIYPRFPFAALIIHFDLVVLAV